MSYLSKWPESFVVAESPHGALMGYVLGKAEGEGPLWHGHVSALTVAPEYRRLGLAKTLMEKFEDICVHTYNAYFVDLFVRSSNYLAIHMYEKFGYSTYRRVLGYYSGELPEDALDMRKALPRYVWSVSLPLLDIVYILFVPLISTFRDKHKQSIVPLEHPIRPEDLEW
jgi:N-terminal acetyltransferase B complex catalytic subunit